MRRSGHNFTLVELLVVMVVAAVLMALAVPAFGKIMQGNAVDRSVSKIQVMVNQVNFAASSSRRHAALVFYESGDDIVMKICQVNSPNEKRDREFIFSHWLEGNKASTLNMGAVICIAKQGEISAPGDIPSTNSTPKTSNFTKVNGIPGLAGGVPAIVFNQYGELAGKLDKCEILVAEGSLDNGKIVYKGTTESGKPTNYLIISINPFSGKCTYRQPGE